MNNILLSGRLTKDMELRYSEKGLAILNNTIAVKVGFGEQADAMFVDFVVFGKQAEYVSTYAAKGYRVVVGGELRIESYQKKDGSTGKSTRIVANMVELFDYKEKSAVASGAPSSFDDDLPF